MAFWLCSIGVGIAEVVMISFDYYYWLNIALAKARLVLSICLSYAPLPLQIYGRVELMGRMCNRMLYIASIVLSAKARKKDLKMTLECNMQEQINITSIQKHKCLNCGMEMTATETNGCKNTYTVPAPEYSE
jgi:hypothetical protein